MPPGQVSGVHFRSFVAAVKCQHVALFGMEMVATEAVTHLTVEPGSRIRPSDSSTFHQLARLVGQRCHHKRLGHHLHSGVEMPMSDGGTLCKSGSSATSMPQSTSGTATNRDLIFFKRCASRFFSFQVRLMGPASVSRRMASNPRPSTSPRSSRVAASRAIVTRLSFTTRAASPAS